MELTGGGRTRATCGVVGAGAVEVGGFGTLTRAMMLQAEGTGIVLLILCLKPRWTPAYTALWRFGRRQGLRSNRMKEPLKVVRRGALVNPLACVKYACWCRES